MEYYEDTHDSDGNYYPGMKNYKIKNKYSSFNEINKEEKEDDSDVMYEHQYSPIYNPYSEDLLKPKFTEMRSDYGSLNKKKVAQRIEPIHRSYNNVVVYEPKNPEDVQALIDYLKRKEPAIVNLDKIDEIRSQRILDFISGAIYALNGSVHRISGNIFLISPEGVEITIPYDPYEIK